MNPLKTGNPIAGLMLALFCSFSAAQTPGAVKPSAPTTSAKPAVKAPSDPLKNLRKSRDEMKGVTWYQHAGSPRYRNANGFYLYFGRHDDGTTTPLRLVIQYFSDDWLFVQRAWGKADGQTVEFPQKRGIMGWERDNGSGDIWEWSDEVVTSAEHKLMLRAMSKSKSATIRFEGRQYFDDKKLNARQLEALGSMISTYEAVTGRAW